MQQTAAMDSTTYETRVTVVLQVRASAKLTAPSSPASLQPKLYSHTQEHTGKVSNTTAEIINQFCNVNLNGNRYIDHIMPLPRTDALTVFQPAYCYGTALLPVQ